MKAILISIRPNWVAKILNGEKTIEIRKTMPKCDLPIDVYIYCTKDRDNLYRHFKGEFVLLKETRKECLWNGKVVAKFTLNKVEKISLPYTKFGKLEWVGCENERTLQTISLDEKDLLKLSCLSEEEIYYYLNFKHSPNKCGYAWHIDNLVVFDKPKELSEFIKTTCKGCPFENTQICHNDIDGKLCRITKAPQSWCYVEAQIWAIN